MVTISLIAIGAIIGFFTGIAFVIAYVVWYFNKHRFM